VADVDSGRSEPLAPGFQPLDYAISRDGKQVVMEAPDGEGKPRLWLASFDRRSPPRQIPGVEGRSAQFGPGGEILISATMKVSDLTAVPPGSDWRMNFTANAPAYTIGAVGGTASILLGTTAPAGGTISNLSTNTQTFNTPMAFRIGTINAANGDVVLVEFFDYACPYCHATNGDVDRLLREDPRLKVVWRELPILGPNSQTAAYVSLGAARQGRFRQFHDAMFALGRPTEAIVAQAVAGVGVTREGETPEGHEELARNFELARALNTNGTPTFVVGDQLLVGAVGYEALKQAVAAARARR